jgi:2-(1,2-epoxy-1,2-dihydrophenyl)acetyl-CoA isomerase
MTDPQPVTLAQDGAVAILTLNRPHAGNTIDMPLALELERLVDQVLADDTVRCLVLTGTGKLFCGGGDIGAFAEAGNDAGTFLFDLASALHRSVLKLAQGSKPLITLINGPAAGAGLSLAALGDIALAVPTAHFTAAYGTLGLTPDGGMSWLLPRLIGLRHAQEVILSNCRIQAEKAAVIGLITRVVPAEALLDEGMALAARLAATPPQAVIGARALLSKAFTTTLDDHLDLETQSIASAGSLPEAQKKIASFLATRKG